jgi:hypothetical protein
MMKRHLAFIAVAALLCAGLGGPADVARAADTKTATAGADLDAKITAAKIAAKEKLAQSKALIAEKAKQVSDVANAAYEKAKAEYEAAQTPEAKAKRASKIKAAKLAAMERVAKAKAVVAEKTLKLADSAKEEYEKLKAAAEKK